MGEVAVIDALMEPLHPSRYRRFLEQVSAGGRRGLAVVARGSSGEVLSDSSGVCAQEVIACLPPEVVAAAVRGLRQATMSSTSSGSRRSAGAALSGCARTTGTGTAGRGPAYQEETPAVSCSARSCMRLSIGPWAEMIDIPRAHKTDLAPKQFTRDHDDADEASRGLRDAGAASVDGGAKSAAARDR